MHLLSPFCPLYLPIIWTSPAYTRLALGCPASSLFLPLLSEHQILLRPHFHESTPCSKALSIHQLELRLFNILSKHLNTVPNSSLSRFLALLWIHTVYLYVHSQMCLLRCYPSAKARPRCHLLHAVFLIAPIESYFLFCTHRVPSLECNSNGICHIIFGIWSCLIHLMHCILLEIRDQVLWIFISFWMPCTRETFSESLFYE